MLYVCNFQNNNSYLLELKDGEDGEGDEEVFEAGGEEQAGGYRMRNSKIVCHTPPDWFKCHRVAS